MGTQRFYKPGSFYRICDRTGFAIRAERTSKEWTGRIVRERSFELRHPQDFVTGVRDDQSVPEPRPRPPDTFINYGKGAEFMVYGDLRQTRGGCFLVSNLSGPQFNNGNTTMDGATNTAGTAMFSVWGGTVSPVLASSL